MHLKSGLVTRLHQICPLIENAMLTGAAREGLVKGGILNWSAARAFADQIIEAFDVRTPNAGNAARSLSGGNLQKFVIGREVLQRPDVFVVNQPTWGVDASAAAANQTSIVRSSRKRCRTNCHFPRP